MSAFGIVEADPVADGADCMLESVETLAVPSPAARRARGTRVNMASRFSSLMSVS
jgi:hypothetical protein